MPPHILLTSVASRVSKPDVFLDGAVEQKVILCNKTDNIGKLGQRHTANVYTTNGDFPIVHIPKTSNQACDGGLASTDGPTSAVNFPPGFSD